MKGKEKNMNTIEIGKDFRQIILSQRESKTPFKEWEGTVIDYLNIVSKDPTVANFAPGRIYNMIMKHGVDEVPETLKTPGYEDLVKYKFFDEKIYGTLEPIHDLMRFLKASARRTETGKRILIMVGPVASGKSTIAGLIKKGLEQDDTPKYAIKGCPIHEEPLHVIPDGDRLIWEKNLGVKIEGTLCPVCQQMIDEKYTEDGIVTWESIPVEKIVISEQKRNCIGTFQPSDPKSQDITELIGRVNMSKIARFGETDPRGYQFDGEMQIANGGMMEYIEILKADVKFLYTLITAAQEQVIKAPGFPQMYIDELILSHTNQTEYDSFNAEKKNEAIHDRMYPIHVPWNLRIDDEVKIYEKMIRESDFNDIHIAPHTLRVAAQFAILSRITPSTKVSSVVEKMKIYNGDPTQDFKKSEIDVKSLLAEGKANGEGMSGISPRFIINALNVALGMKEEKCCINPIDVIRALMHNFSHHIGINEEDSKRFKTMLTGEKESVVSEYKEVARKEVNMAFLYAYEEQANNLFDRYMKNVESSCKKEKVLDSITGEYMDPDEKLMRSIEELINVPVNSKDVFRNGIFVHMVDKLKSGGKFTYLDHPQLKEGIEKKLMGDLKNVVNLSIGDTTSTNPKAGKHRDRAMKTLMETRGYCPHCASMLLSFLGEILRKE